MSKLSHSELKALITSAGLSETDFRTVKAQLKEVPDWYRDFEMTTEMTNTKFFVALCTLVVEQNPDAVTLLQALIPEQNLPLRPDRFSAGRVLPQGGEPDVNAPKNAVGDQV